MAFISGLNNMNYITLDIETIPTQRDDVKEYITKTIKHPGTIKLEKSIAKWNEEERPDAIEEAINKTGLDGAFGQVVCIGYAQGRDDASVVFGLDEIDVLEKFNQELYSTLDKKDWLATSVVGHNVLGFDLRFLLQRFMINGIAPHPLIRRACLAKPWETEKVFDTMTQFAGVGKTISLDKLCLALGLPGKGDITGADVWPMVKAGRIKEVATYCMDDVEKTREVYKRMVFAV